MSNLGKKERKKNSEMKFGNLEMDNKTSTAWTDDLPICSFTGAGDATNQTYRYALTCPFLEKRSEYYCEIVTGIYSWF